MNPEDLDRLHRQAEEELGRYPGVVGVAYGFKRRGGVQTGEVGFCVYVVEKKPHDALAPADVLPTEYHGFPVDVDPVPDPKRLECRDRETHSPLVGGITLSNLRLGADGLSSPGTLGFFATLDGVAAPDNVVAITNHHVAMASGASVGDPIYQPARIPAPTGGIGIDLSRRNPIGKIERAGRDGDGPFAYPGEPEDQYFVDAASVRIDISMSSWCNTNCGQSIANKIRLLGLPTGDALVDVARIVDGDVTPPYPLFKVGARSSRTEGVLTRTRVPLKSFEGRVIEVTAKEKNCEGNLRFADEGDSGSALVNAAGKLVGLVFGVDPTNLAVAFACHIHPVIALLGITPITNAHPPDARVTRSDADLVVEGRPNQTRALRDRLLTSEEGRRIMALVEEHRHEVVELVNHNRGVTIAWRRNQGPAFLNRAMHNARDPEQPIPHEIEGVSREALLRAMARALEEHGSDALRAVVRASREDVIAQAGSLDSLEVLVDRLAERQTA